MLLNLPRLQALEKIQTDGIALYSDDPEQVDSLLDFCRLAYDNEDMAQKAVAQAVKVFVDRQTAGR